MSVIVKIPEGARARKPQNRFVANFGLGVYDFELIAGNTNQLVIPLNPSCIYLIDRDGFSANLLDGVWLEGQLTADDYPRFILTRKLTPNINIYAEPSRCLNYKDNDEQLTYFKTDQLDDELLITFYGKVKQVQAMGMVAQLSTQVSFTIYQITEPEWVKWFNLPFTKLDPVGIYQK